MGDHSNALTHELDVQRAPLGSHFEELEGKVKDIADWRRQLQKTPVTMMGLAVGGGILLSSVIGGRHSRAYYAPRRDLGQQWRNEPGFGGSERATRSQLRRASDTWDTIKGALIGVATGGLQNFLKDVVPGFTEEFHKVQTREHPPRESEHTPETPRVAAD